MQPTTFVVNFSFILLALALIGTVCSFRKSVQIYELAQKQSLTNSQQVVIQSVARNEEGDGKKKLPPPLVRAVMKKTVTINTLSKLMESGADINAVEDEWSRSALHFASRQCSPEVVAWLVKNGADINQPDRVGYTPLMVAINEGRLETTASKLLELGADARTVDKQATSVLHLACMLDMDIPKTVAQLISHGADVNQQSDLGVSPLMVAIQEGHIESVRTFLELGADIHAVDTLGNSALHMAYAYYWQFPQIVDILISHGADINQLNNQGDTPIAFLHYSIDIDRSIGRTDLRRTRF